MAKGLFGDWWGPNAMKKLSEVEVPVWKSREVRIKELQDKINALRGKPFRVTTNEGRTIFEVAYTDSGEFHFTIHGSGMNYGYITLTPKQVTELVDFFGERMFNDGREEGEGFRSSDWGTLK